MKQGAAVLSPAVYKALEIPRNTPTGFVTAFFAVVTGFALIWHIWWMAVLGLVGAFATFVAFAWRDKAEDTLALDVVAAAGRALPRAGPSEEGDDGGFKGPPGRRIITGYGFWIFLLSDIVMFSGFFAAYAVLAHASAGGPTGQQLFDLFPAKGIYGLCWGHWGWRPVTHAAHAVAEPKDIAGSKVRIQPGAIYAATYKTLDAAPTVIDVSEVYLALSQHAVDAVEVPLISLIASKFYEVAKHITLTNFVYNAGAIMASLDDTCVLHRGGSRGLSFVHRTASDVLRLGGCGTPAGRRRLVRFCRGADWRGLSTGGSADLLAATLFLDAVTPEGRTCKH